MITRIFMRKPSKYEKETIINFNEAEDTANIYTFNADLKRRLAEFSRKYPLLCRLEHSTAEGSAFRFCGQRRKVPDMGAFYGKTTGLHPAFLS